MASSEPNIVNAGFTNLCSFIQEVTMDGGNLYSDSDNDDQLVASAFNGNETERLNIGSKANGISNRALAQCARREREKAKRQETTTLNHALVQRARREQEKSISLHPGLENDHASNIRGKMKMVEHHSCIPNMPYVPPVNCFIQGVMMDGGDLCSDSDDQLVEELEMN
ncbi:hypothetical protein Dimus_001844 [Dionaea muscipula]